MEVRLPELSENNADVVITFWHVKENDQIKKEQELLEVVTDKATFDVPAPCDGILTKIVRQSGEEVKANDLIAVIKETSG